MHLKKKLSESLSSKESEMEKSSLIFYCYFLTKLNDNKIEHFFKSFFIVSYIDSFQSLQKFLMLIKPFSEHD